MFGTKTVFESLEEEKVDEFVFKFYSVLEESQERSLAASTLFYSKIQEDLLEYAEEGAVDLNDLEEIESSRFGTADYISWDAAEAFDEAVREAYEELGIGYEG
ncbi:hypothetical protein [Candidatus Nanohalobium constans]|uniref:Uncharacterized protein n=1 Tax=Candidatus Nanohalobium constans TaxID=2565781 RepID=A0A5Q0UGE2_9ARCH|nr:hypothetical protein [Candidatus Nanohalobium constans]QGA80059.1 hypothetical protein LC1Nh_0151 [Candidatus Nanohalobium constans]